MSRQKISAAETRRVEIATLVAKNPRAKTADIAEELGVTQRTVQRALKAHGEVIEKLKGEYLGQLGEDLLKTGCVEALQHLVTQRQHLPTLLNSVQHVEKLFGVAPVAEASQEAQPQPLFSLPAGARVAVKVG